MILLLEIRDSQQKQETKILKLADGEQPLYENIIMMECASIQDENSLGLQNLKQKYRKLKQRALFNFYYLWTNYEYSYINMT